MLCLSKRVLHQRPVAMAPTTALGGSQSDKHGVRKGSARETHATPVENPGEQERLPTLLEGLAGVLRLGQPGAGVLPAGGIYSRIWMLAVRRGCCETPVCPICNGGHSQSPTGLAVSGAGV